MTTHNESLDRRMKEAGMFTVDEMMRPFNQFQIHAGMTDLDFFEEWLERKVREYGYLRAQYELGDKLKDDDMFEWVLGHSGSYHDVLVNFRAAKESQMGKNIKTQMDYDMINDLARELHKADPKNEKLQHYLNMDNFEGAELRKCLKV